MGFGEKLFATPWHVLKLDTDNKRFILDIDQERLKNAPGFDKIIGRRWPISSGRPAFIPITTSSRTGPNLIT